MNMHPGGPGQPPPGPPHHFQPPPHHPHHNPYPGDPSQGYPPPGVPHHLHMQPHPGSHPGDEHMDDPMHDPDESDGQHVIGESGGDGAPKRKRRRQALSCTECKRRKIKCDRNNPCQPCVRRGEGNKCKWHIIEPVEKFVTRAEYDDLRQKFDALEHAVAQMTGRPPSNIYQAHMGGPWGIPPMGEPDTGSGSARSPSLVVDPNLQVTDPNTAGTSTTTNANSSPESKKTGAQMLVNAGERGEHLRHQVIPQQATATTLPTTTTTAMPMFLGPNPPMLSTPGIIMPPLPTPMRTLPILPNLHPDNWSQLGGAASPGMILGLAAVCPPYPSSLLPGTKQTGDEKNMPGPLPFATPLSMSNGYWVSGLPPKHMCEAIVDYYFDYVSWSHAIVLRSSLASNLKSFWTLPNEAASSAWVALYFMVLYHGVSNMDPEDPAHAAIVSNNLSDWRRSCQTFWHGAQFALSQCDLAAPKEIETIQALTLLAFVYLSLDVKGWQAFAPTLAFIIRLAQNMGMGQLTKEIPKQAKPGLKERELQRRLWWSLVTLDWQYAAHLNNTYCIHPNQFDTVLPANLDLEDLEEEEASYQEQPASEHTSAALLRAKCEIAELTRKLSDEKPGNDDIDFDALTKYSRDVEDTLARLPSFLVTCNDALEKQDPSVMWERVNLSIGVHSSTITLYRSLFLHHYSDPKYAHAVDSSVTSAEKVLKSLKELQAAKSPGRKWWGVLLHCYKAAVTLLLDHEHKRQSDARVPLTATRSELVQMLINLLEEGAEVIVFAKKASLVLQHLLDTAQQELSRPPPSPLKRPRDSAADGAHTGSNGANGTSAAGSEVGIWSNIFELELDVEVMETEELPQGSARNNLTYTAPASAERERVTRRTSEWS